MKQTRVVLVAMVLCTLPVAGHCTSQAGEGHDAAWWRAVVTNGFVPPADAPIESLVQELSGYLGSADPGLRDEVAYTVLTQWLYVQRSVPVDLRRELVDDWRANLTHRIGEEGTDSVFLRSFSALMLSVAAALDNDEPYLEDAGFDALLESALAYLRDEQDTRGFDAAKGWMHSVAHTADLLKFLGRSRHLGPGDQSAILTAISAKLDSVDHVLVFGEHERLARAVVSILARDDADLVAFEAFLRSLEPVPFEGLPTQAALADRQNRKHLAVSLYALLATDGRDLDGLAQAGERVRVLLERMM